MKTAGFILLTIWLLAVSLTSCARAGEVGDQNEFMARQVESAYLDKANNIEVRNACLRLTGIDDMKMCKLNVCYQVGIPFTSCIGK